MSELLDLGKRLVAAGVPVVVVGPNDIPRQAWKGIRYADQCDLSLYRDGDALLMLGGHGIDVVDVDTKGNGSIDNLPPLKHYGITRTPSGGAHYIVPSTGVGKMRLDTHLGPVGDYCGGRRDLSGRLGAFLPGSVRTKYPEGGYDMEVEWDIEGCLAATPDPDLILALLDAGGTLEQPVSGYTGSSDVWTGEGLHPQAQVIRDRELALLDAMAADAWHPGAHWDDRTFRSACVLARLGNSPWSGYDLDAAYADLLEHAPVDEGWTVKDHEAKWASAIATVGDEGLRQPTTAEEDFAPLEDDFWTRTPVLSHVRHAARARMIAPEMLLAVVLLRVLVEVPTTTMLPPTVGSAAPLNLGVACVGRSGGGKSSAFAVSRELLGLDGMMQADRERVLGTGEGLVEAYLQSEMTVNAEGKRTRTGRKVLIDDPRLLFTVDEVDQLKAVKERTGSTIGPVLRSALTGGMLGQTNADPDRRRHVAAGSYRACLSIGVQPTRSMTLLEDADAGTPQRLLWVDETDPAAPDEPPSWPGPLQIAWPTEWPEYIGCTHDFATEVRKARRMRLRGEGDPVEGHRLLTQHKIAAALAVLHGQTFATMRWLELAGQLIDRSFRVQEKCRHATWQLTREQGIARAKESGHAKVVEAETMKVEVARVDTMQERLLVKIAAAGEEGISKMDLLRKVQSSRRPVAQRALDLLTASGKITMGSANKGPGNRLRAVPGD